MNEWDRLLSEDDRRMRYACGDEPIHRMTMMRALDLLDTYFGEVTDQVWRGMGHLYPDTRTDVYADGSHVVRYGPKGENVLYGEGGGKVQLQDQFMVSSLIGADVPTNVELYPGNMNDPPQFEDFIDQLQYYLNPGSLIVMDHGGSGRKIAKSILSRSNEYLTRVRMNASDDITLEEHLDEAFYVGEGTVCIMSVFDSSRKTNYLFFSIRT